MYMLFCIIIRLNVCCVYVYVVYMYMCCICMLCMYYVYVMCVSVYIKKKQFYTILNIF